MNRFASGVCALIGLVVVACSAPPDADETTGNGSDEIKKSKGTPCEPPPAPPPKGPACGAATCAADEVCCNASCGICTKPGMACTQQACAPEPPPPAPVKCGAITCGAGEECCNPSCGICVQPGMACIQVECAPAK